MFKPKIKSTNFRHFHFNYSGANLADPSGIIVAVETPHNSRPQEGTLPLMCSYTGWRIALIRWLVERWMPQPPFELAESK